MCNVIWILAYPKHHSVLTQESKYLESLNIFWPDFLKAFIMFPYSNVINITILFFDALKDLYHLSSSKSWCVLQACQYLIMAICSKRCNNCAKIFILSSSSLKACIGLRNPALKRTCKQFVEAIVCSLHLCFYMVKSWLLSYCALIDEYFATAQAE